MNDCWRCYSRYFADLNLHWLLPNFHPLHLDCYYSLALLELFLSNAEVTLAKGNNYFVKVHVVVAIATELFFFFNLLFFYLLVLLVKFSGN